MEMCAQLLSERYAECRRAYPRFEVPFEEFRDAIAAAALKYLVEARQSDVEPSLRDLDRFIGELKLPDLYLGLGCLRSDEHAWWEFDRQHRSFIERWTRHLVSGDTNADEIVDSVYVELFGTRMVAGVRQSKFRSYTGRGSLRGWLRAIILNAAVDLHRAPKLEVSVDNWSDSSDESTRQDPSSPETEGSMLTTIVRQRYRSATAAALDQALSALDDHETLLLLYYHVEGLKLREIARIVEQPRSPMRQWFERRSSRQSRVHESTVMRWLNKLYQKIFKRFQSELSTTHGLRPEEIEICTSIAADDPACSISLSRPKRQGEQLSQRKD